MSLYTAFGIYSLRAEETHIVALPETRDRRSMALVILSLIVAVMLHTHAQPASGSEETLEVGRTKRLLPDNEHCDPRRGECKKGDWVDDDIADCDYDWSLTSWTCDVRGASIFSWEVEPDEDDRCKPVGGKPIRCGDPGTNTRCVCSGYKIQFNTCVCQYWTEETPGENEPVFCTGYYRGGTSGVHHWACCNNCNDITSISCDGVTYQGGSSNNYCGTCGTNIAENKGRKKYYFNCGSCAFQSACQTECNDKAFGLTTLPGLCWKWLDCFYGCCQYISHPSNRAISPKQVTNLEFCGDGSCTGSETHVTCPGDCCYQINAVNCSNDPRQCTPSCCQMETCCVYPETVGHGAAHVFGPLGSICLLLVALFSCYI